MCFPKLKSYSTSFSDSSKDDGFMAAATCAILRLNLGRCQSHYSSGEKKTLSRKHHFLDHLFFLMMDTSKKSSCMWWHHQTGLLQGCNQPEPNRIAMSLMQNMIENNCPACAWARSHPFQPGQDWWAPGGRKLQPRAMHGSQLWNLAGGKNNWLWLCDRNIPPIQHVSLPKKMYSKG